jgi:hypothetical protein
MPETPPLARTNAEAHLYMDLQPCPGCGRGGCEYRSSVVSVDGDLASRYTGTCPRCGTQRVYVFRLPDRILPPPAGGVRFGGPDPSRLLDPGVWLSYADDRARRVPADRAGLGDQERRARRFALASALAAVEETLKFIPPGADEVPLSAFTSPEGRAVRDREPGRFTRARLEAVRDSYARSLTAW